MPTDFPINWYSRLVTDSSGVSPSYQYLLLHADRASVSAGTNFVDHSSWGQTLYTRGTGVIQSAAAGYFGSSGLLLTATTESADNMRLGFNVPTILTTTATDSKPAMQVEQFVYITSLNSAGMTLWEITNSGQTDYGTAFLYQSAGDWRLSVHWFRNVLGMFFSHEYGISVSTGSWNHFALLRVNTEGPGSHRIGVFHNGSQLTPVTGGNPSGGNGDWRDCGFANPQGDIVIWGGNLLSSVGQGFGTLPGYHDEFRLLYDTTDGLVFNPSFGTASDFYSFTIPTAPYAPIDGTFSITAKVLSLNSFTLSPTTNGGLGLGSSGSTWLDLWSSGTAYLNNVGQNFMVVGTFRAQFGSTNTYIYSSSSGFMTFAAGTQIDFLQNVGLAAKNFIFDTVTGVKFGTTTNVKMGFFGVTPVVQQGGNIVTALQTLGLVTGGTLPAITPTVTTTSTTYTLTTADQYLFCSSGTSFAVTFPAALGSYKEFMVKNIGAGTVTLTANAADSIDGASTSTLAQYAFSKLIDFAIPNTTYLKLYLAFDGGDGSTTFTDSSPLHRTMTAVGNAQIDTAQSVFGGASGLFDGSGDYVTMASTADLNIGSNPFTFKVRTRLVNTTGNNMFCSRVTDTNGYFYFGLEGSTLRFRDFNSGNNFNVTASLTIASATWYEFAAMGSAGSVRLMFNGVVVATATIPAFVSRSTGLTIAAMTDNGSYVMNGWLDEFLFWNGWCQSTGNYDLATAAFTSAPGQWLLIT